MPAGRPTDYNEALCLKICERISDGESLRKICADEDMPNKSSVFLWLSKYKEFSDQYARAKEESAELFADEIVSIADEVETVISEDGNKIALDSVAIARNRLRIDARKWVASKLKPKKYGDKLELAGDAENPIQTITSFKLVPLTKDE